MTVEGLKGLEYYDNTDGMSEKSEASGAVQIGEEVDRIYKAAPDEIRVNVLIPTCVYRARGTST